MNNSEKCKALAEKISDLTQRIRDHQNNTRLLLDFATGLKTLSIEKCYQEGLENDVRLVNTLKNLHVDMRALQKELTQLKKNIFGVKENVQQRP